MTMKLFYGIVLVMMVFVSACAQQAAEPEAEPSVPAAAPESSRPRRRWRCMPRRSTKKARWTNSRPSPRSMAPPITGWNPIPRP